MDQDLLNQYFKDTWKSRFHEHGRTGIQLAGQIRDEHLVLDVGCGNNNFKGHVKNLVGIDPVFEDADVITTIEDYVTDSQFDIALCLDSMIFGSRGHIEKQIEKLVALMKQSSTIHFRSNSLSEKHRYDKAGIETFYWTQEDHFVLSKKFGYRLFGFYPDRKGSEDEVLHTVWIRNQGAV